EPRYGRALVERLAAATPMDPGSAETLARARGETVRASLLQHGVEASRVRLEGPASEKAEDEGVPTALTLRADLPAQQQAQSAPAARAADATVRRVQQRLNAAGFEAGPVDGILGPMTESGLTRFQRSRGLEATGELDRGTLAALGVSGEASTGATGAATGGGRSATRP
ncbi:MAG TPA: peptidoglycan-binding domain-containing protein, partial [Burkholderiales bacterium]|nr:peptidoglycan-binding domain-containing protein [Burkholderiales bacterium]